MDGFHPTARGEPAVSSIFDWLMAFLRQKAGVLGRDWVKTEENWPLLFTHQIMAAFLNLLIFNALDVVWKGKCPQKQVGGGVFPSDLPISWPESGVVALIFIVRRWGK
jgi:hypothetical protein